MKQPAFVRINDPNKQARLRQFKFTANRHYTVIHGLDANGFTLGGFKLRIPTDQIEVFTLALRKFHASELGCMALDAEYRDLVDTLERERLLVSLERAAQEYNKE